MSTSFSHGAGGRKRVLSNSYMDDSITERKRPRVSSVSAEFRSHLLGQPLITLNPERLPRVFSLHEDSEYHGARYARPLSRASSFAGPSRPTTPVPLSIPSNESSSTLISHSGMALMRSISCASLPPTGPLVPVYPELSAKYFLRNPKIIIDFSVPSPDPSISCVPVGWSTDNHLFFTRGNRIHYKNMSTNEDVGQLCKLQDSYGALRMIETVGSYQPNWIAVGASKGYIQIWDIKAKKMTSCWSTKGVASMRWNGHILTVGGLKGTIRHYDTRISSTSKMKEQVRKVTRHQAQITSLAWNVDGKLLASGDKSGIVYCWDTRQHSPLDVGEFVQRRKKIQHSGAITALTWCPWQSNLLASGDSSDDSKGAIRLWTVPSSCTTSSESNAASPGKIEFDSQITSLHFSQHCKELLSTHGPGRLRTTTNEEPLWPVSTANSIVVHSYPSLRHVTTVAAAAKEIKGSCMSSNGLKIVLVVPEENKLRVWDVWGKRKEVKKQPSFTVECGIR